MIYRRLLLKFKGFLRGTAIVSAFKKVRKMRPRTSGKRSTHDNVVDE